VVTSNSEPRGRRKTAQSSPMPRIRAPAGDEPARRRIVLIKFLSRSTELAITISKICTYVGNCCSLPAHRAIRPLGHVT
jgi:hypothetical protein